MPSYSDFESNEGANLSLDNQSLEPGTELLDQADINFLMEEIVSVLDDPKINSQAIFLNNTPQTKGELYEYTETIYGIAQQALINDSDLLGNAQLFSLLDKCTQMLKQNLPESEHKNYQTALVESYMIGLQAGLFLEESTDTNQTEESLDFQDHFFSPEEVVRAMQMYESFGLKRDGAIIDSINEINVIGANELRTLGETIYKSYSTALERGYRPTPLDYELLSGISKNLNILSRSNNYNYANDILIQAELGGIAEQTSKATAKVLNQDANSSS